MTSRDSLHTDFYLFISCGEGRPEESPHFYLYIVPSWNKFCKPQGLFVKGFYNSKLKKESSNEAEVREGGRVPPADRMGIEVPPKPRVVEYVAAMQDLPYEDIKDLYRDRLRAFEFVTTLLQSSMYRDKKRDVNYTPDEAKRDAWAEFFEENMSETENRKQRWQEDVGKTNKVESISVNQLLKRFYELGEKLHEVWGMNKQVG